MTSDERRDAALDHVQAARKAIHESDMEPDPVAQRRLDARAAAHLRKAADLLDDHRRLSE